MTDIAFSDLEVTDKGAIRCLTLNRPQSKNGLTLELCTALVAALDAAGRDQAVRAVLLSGRGEAFCSGLDLKVGMVLFQSLQGADDAAVRSVGEQHMRQHFHALIRAVRHVEKPVVAFLNGPAVGFGCDLALACDLRLGTTRASFAELFVKRGLMPDGGSTYTLPRLIGVSKALEMMLLGDTIEAEDAARLSLLNRICSDFDMAFEIVQRLAQGAPLALRAIKRSVYAALDGSLEQALEGEVVEQMKLLRSKDCMEGMTAFFMKRPPEFSGT